MNESLQSFKLILMQLERYSNVELYWEQVSENSSKMLNQEFRVKCSSHSRRFEFRTLRLSNQMNAKIEWVWVPNIEILS